MTDYRRRQPAQDRWVRAGWLMSLSDVAHLAGVLPTTVRVDWAGRLSDPSLEHPFPRPLLYAPSGRLWYLPEIVEWLAATGRMDPPPHLQHVEPPPPLGCPEGLTAWVVEQGEARPLDPTDLPPPADAGLTWVIVYAADEQAALDASVLFDDGLHPNQLELDLWGIQYRRGQGYLYP